MFYLIYKLTNLLNNKIYVGKHITNNKEDSYMGSGAELKKDLKKLGVSNFKKEILFECESVEELNLTESSIVNIEFVQREDTYNKRVGGLGGWEYINENGLNNRNNQNKIAHEKHLKLLKTNAEYAEMFCKKVREGLAKISKDVKSQNLKEAWRKHGHPWVGRKHSEETKQKLREKAKLRAKTTKNNQLGKCWVFNEELKINKSIKKEDLDEYLQLGWIKGRKMSF